MLRTTSAVIVSVLLGGCASQSAAPDIALTAPAAAAPASGKAAVSYELSKAELGYDCAKLTGHIKLRISMLRGTADRTPTTEASRKMQQLATIAGGGSTHGVDPAADRARDRQMLDAYNRQLAAKTCKPFDIDAELAGTPTPGAGKPAAKTAPPAAGKS